MPASPPQFSGRSTFEVVEYAHERHLATLMIIFHDPHCVEYSIPGHPERPEGITRRGIERWVSVISATSLSRPLPPSTVVSSALPFGTLTPITGTGRRMSSRIIPGSASHRFINFRPILEPAHNHSRTSTIIRS